MMGIVGVIVNCALIGQSGTVHRMFPNITATQTIVLIILLEVNFLMTLDTFQIFTSKSNFSMYCWCWKYGFHMPSLISPTGLLQRWQKSNGDAEKRRNHHHFHLLHQVQVWILLNSQLKLNLFSSETILFLLLHQMRGYNDSSSKSTFSPISFSKYQ